MHSTASERGADLFAKPHVRVWGNGSSMRCDRSLLWSLGLTADLLTAGRCIDGFPALGVFYYINQRLGRLIVAEESGLRGC